MEHPGGHTVEVDLVEQPVEIKQRVVCEMTRRDADSNHLTSAASDRRPTTDETGLPRGQVAFLARMMGGMPASHTIIDVAFDLGSLRHPIVCNSDREPRWYDTC